MAWSIVAEEDSIGKRLEAFARGRYRTMKAFGEAVGMSSQQLSNYVSGRAAPNSAALQRFAAAGLNVNWLLTGEGRPDAGVSGSNAGVGEIAPEDVVESGMATEPFEYRASSADVSVLTSRIMEARDEASARHLAEGLWEGVLAIDRGLRLLRGRLGRDGEE